MVLADSSVGLYLEKIFSLEGKVMLFTGATGGIGRVLCKGFSGAGASVALCDVDAGKLAELENEISAEIPK